MSAIFGVLKQGAYRSKSLVYTWRELQLYSSADTIDPQTP